MTYVHCPNCNDLVAKHRRHTYRCSTCRNVFDVPTNHPLPSPKFTDRERAAYDWLYDRGIRPWLVDLVDKTARDGKRKYASLVELAHAKGWEG